MSDSPNRTFTEEQVREQVHVATSGTVNGIIEYLRKQRNNPPNGLVAFGSGWRQAHDAAITELETLAAEC